MNVPETAPPAFGILAEFETPEALVEAAEKAYAEGYRQLDGYSSVSVHGLDEALHYKRNCVPFFTLLGGILGGCTGLGVQELANVYHYPLIIGGKPFNSWPAFLPIAYEMTILTAAFFTVISMMVMNGLPQPYHPLFNVRQFERASRDGFFLCIEATDPRFNFEQTEAFMQTLQATGVYTVRP